jgi:hypothetical protein
MARLNNIGGVNKNFGNGASPNEASLIGVHKERDEVAKTKGKTFGVNLETTVLEGIGLKLSGRLAPAFLGKSTI